MAKFTPSIGASGLYRLLEPFTAKLLPGVSYTCTGLRSFQDITAGGIDPFTTYYEPYGLSKEIYQLDVTNKAYIVSLQADAGNGIAVPSTYIDGMPDVNGVPYLGTILALDLSIVPSRLNLSLLKEKLVDTVRETIGVIAEIRLITTTALIIKTPTEHTVIESTRELNMTNAPSDYAKYLEASTEVASLRQKIQELEAWIVAHRPV